jgi:D-alanine-D-alanine ligase
MPKKNRVGILFGGRSAEHEVSLQSAKNIIDAIDTNKYELVRIGIDKKGRWHLNEESRFLLPTSGSELPELPESGENLALIPGRQGEQLVALSGQQTLGSLDVIFTVRSAKMAPSKDCSSLVIFHSSELVFWAQQSRWIKM